MVGEINIGDQALTIFRPSLRDWKRSSCGGGKGETEFSLYRIAAGHRPPVMGWGGGSGRVWSDSLYRMLHDSRDQFLVAYPRPTPSLPPSLMLSACCCTVLYCTEACTRCRVCEGGGDRARNHCPERTVLGILGKHGTYAEYLTLPCRNLHVVSKVFSREKPGQGWNGGFSSSPTNQDHIHTYARLVYSRPDPYDVARPTTVVRTFHRFTHAPCSHETEHG